MTFVGRDMLYWKGFEEEFDADAKEYEVGMELGAIQFLRASEILGTKGVTLWGNNSREDWYDIIQGKTNNCYLISTMGSMAEKPHFIRDVFVTDTENEAGIYAFRFFIRGKPWIVTIDDYLPFIKPTPWTEP
jgi:hypothetical protein